MSTAKNPYSLFGLDLSLAGRYFLQGWREAAEWPAFRWMNPRTPVRVIAADGSTSIRMGCVAATVDFKGAVDALAVELPEDLVLRRTLVLPQLSDADVESAVSLDVRNASPFPEGDLAWGYVRRSGAAGDAIKVEAVLSSRALVARHLEGLSAALGGSDPQVWAGGPAPIPLQGFGAKGEPKGGGMRKALVSLLALLGVGLAVVVALTPLLQVRARAIDAIAQNERLLKEAAPQAALRADLMRFNVNLESIGKYLGQYSNPLLTLDELSRLLPDDVVVNTLEFKGDTVRITGQANNASKLLDLLAAQPGYVEVKSPSATSRVQGSAKEYFTIELKVQRREKVQ